MAKLATTPPARHAWDARLVLLLPPHLVPSRSCQTVPEFKSSTASCSSRSLPRLSLARAPPATLLRAPCAVARCGYRGHEPSSPCAAPSRSPLARTPRAVPARH
ncbi:hypothetical protein PVAP13_6NG345101 [Panicum virgatum]|uniref:Uncharacterized protein n=1 Tax=Panicum virgatum TaxID=38727 RepID=A0A8T0R4A9_PANVG|nr:hypothetical protein PVAP13_6NG345101 [Panicum virgatum]